MDHWTCRSADYWPSTPYPGERSECSWRLVDGSVHRVTPVDSGWLDVATGEAVELAGRVFILAYGSNANPNKMLGVNAVMLQADITDAQAVWCNARRRTDGSVVSTLVERPGHLEACPVLALRPEELPKVDMWEEPAYTRINFWGSCVLETGTAITPEVYVGGPTRPPLRIDGNYVPLHLTKHAVVDQLVPR
ncbi:hypothetical protein [Mycobacterium sp. Aquia_213]|uniref:hypothetical protein n=1 Tax=Mycobacterium sp. Aquia_213 TaxID=2991728 RepID=UPI0022712317|nr:hypothetical protein [Mycobacterium sp. Aquia_213]WAC92611.1 hypothetical protein LMQ14_05410 [Mycobacterium sp. Aquia_213]